MIVKCRQCLVGTLTTYDHDGNAGKHSSEKSKTVFPPSLISKDLLS